jgi:hypothetical protein
VDQPKCVFVCVCKHGNSAAAALACLWPAQVAVRNVRKDVLKKVEKGPELSKDLKKGLEDAIQKLTDTYCTKVGPPAHGAQGRGPEAPPFVLARVMLPSQGMARGGSPGAQRHLYPSPVPSSIPHVRPRKPPKPLTVNLLSLDGCPSTYLFYSPTVGPRFCLVKARSCK